MPESLAVENLKREIQCYLDTLPVQGDMFAGQVNQVEVTA